MLLILTVISIAPLLKFIGSYGFIPWLIIFGVTLHFADKAEKIKKENDISTYKEIVAFAEWKQLDEIEKQREMCKRPYQTVCYVVGTAIISFLGIQWKRQPTTTWSVPQYCSCRLPFCVFTVINDYFLVKYTFNSIF